jgi:hypothetical protein
LWDKFLNIEFLPHLPEKFIQCVFILMKFLNLPNLNFIPNLWNKIAILVLIIIEIVYIKRKLLNKDITIT